MRETCFGAWLAMTPLLIAACSGTQFTTDDEARAGRSSGTKAESASGSPTAGSAPAGAGRGTGDSSLGNGGATNSGPGNTGGTGEAAGGAAEGGADGTEPCAAGAVRFRMLPSSALSPNHLCDAGCGTGWLTITDIEGATAFSIFSACGTASCDSCEMLPCAAAACLPTPLTSEGREILWDGTYLAEGTCGDKMACQRHACVAPGKYRAKACAALDTGESNVSGACQPKDAQLCTEVEFDFPAAHEVKLVLE